MNDKKFGKSNKMQVQKLPTGIEGFDDVCRGGLPVSRSTLVSGTSGTGKTVFSLQYLHHGICNFDEPGIFVTFEESPLDIIRNDLKVIPQMLQRFQAHQNCKFHGVNIAEKKQFYQFQRYH